MRQRIQETHYSESFPARVNVDLLTQDEASGEYTRLVDPEAASWFSLPDDSELVHCRREVVGSWFDDFNRGSAERVATIMGSSVNWKGGDNVIFFTCRWEVFAATWSTFLENWISFVACEDDSALLVLLGSGSFCAVLFFGYWLFSLGARTSQYLCGGL